MNQVWAKSNAYVPSDMPLKSGECQWNALYIQLILNPGYISNFIPDEFPALSPIPSSYPHRAASPWPLPRTTRSPRGNVAASLTARRRPSLSRSDSPIRHAFQSDSLPHHSSHIPHSNQPFPPKFLTTNPRPHVPPPFPIAPVPLRSPEHWPIPLWSARKSISSLSMNYTYKAKSLSWNRGVPMASRRGQVLLAVFYWMHLLSMRLATVPTQVPISTQGLCLVMEFVIIVSQHLQQWHYDNSKKSNRTSSRLFGKCSIFQFIFEFLF